MTWLEELLPSLRCDAEAHDITFLLNWYRASYANDEQKARIERALRAFIARRRLEKPVTIKQIREEFNLLHL